MSLEQSNPLVTVYIPTFNRVELLKRAVDSVRNQTYKNLEIIIVDDCSKDGTHEYLENISKKDSRIRYFIKEKNSGACVSRNIAIENAKGEFITGLDDDDYFEGGRIKKFIDKWETKDNNTKVLYSLYRRKTVKGISQPLSIFKKMFLKSKVSANDLLYFFYTGNQIFTETNLMKNNLFDLDMPAWQDFECFYRLLKNNMCYAELVISENYIVDISHPHERISTKKNSNILLAFNLFCEKHSLSLTQLSLLECHLFNYPNITIQKDKILKRFLFKPSILDFKRLLGVKVV